MRGTDDVQIPEKIVAEVVSEASMKMSDPNYSAVMVGGFVQGQGIAAKYLSAHEQELGGPEAVVNAIFHAALIGECFRRSNNRTVRAMTFDELDHVSGDDAESRLKDQQPAILSYISTNVEHEEMRTALVLIALAMEWIS